jgi:tetratricopeptide (TPR) repeat protein
LYAQPDSLLNLHPTEGIRSLDHWFKNVPHHTLDTPLQVLEETYRKQGKPQLERFAWLAKKIVWIERGESRTVVESRYFEVLKEVAKKGWHETEGELWVLLGSFYSGSEQYGKAFEYCLRGFYRFQELGFEQNPNLYRYLGYIADAYYRLGDWESCLKYLSLLNKQPDTYFIAGPRFHVENSMALVYRNMNRFDSSEFFFKASYESARELNDSFWMALSLGNLGYNYYLKGNYDEAEPLLLRDYEQSLQAKQLESAVNAGLSLADIFVKTGRPSAARQIMDNIEKVVLQKRYTRWMRNWFENQYGLAKLQGNVNEAVIFADSALKYRDIAANNTNAQIMANTRSKVEAEQYLNRISLLESNRQRAVLLRNALLGGIALITIILLLIINRIRSRHRFSVEKATLEKKQASILLEQLQGQLDQYTMHLRNKTQLIEQVELELSQLKAAGSALYTETERSFTELLQSSILTEEEWQRFRTLFEKVHPGFLSKIRQQFPDLTPAETRILVLTRLKLTNKEMMAMLGIGYDAIKKTRQRLRKKINLPDEATLDQWIEKM